MGTYRERTQTGPSYPGGSITRVSTGYTYSQNGSTPRSFSTCEDIAGDSNDGSTLQIRKFRVEAYPCSLSGNGKYSNMTPGWYATGPMISSIVLRSFPDVPGNSVIATKTMAGTNPSRPVVDVPVALLELGSTLSTIYRLVNTRLALLRSYHLAGKVAEANLLYQFELRPLISDISGVLNFSEELDKRVKELQDMADKGGKSSTFRKKVPFTGTFHEFDKSYPVNSSGNGPTLNAPMELVGTQRAWGFAKWTPMGSFPKSASSLRALARKAVLGLTVDGSTAWELLPWSWLIDYGFSIGSYMAAHRNIVPAYCTQLYVCRHTTMVRSVGESVDDNVRCPSWKTYSEYKTRTPVSFTTPAAHLPFLSGSQMSIIASLGVLKMR